MNRRGFTGWGKKGFPFLSFPGSFACVRSTSSPVNPVNPAILSESFAFAAGKNKNLGQDYRINRIGREEVFSLSQAPFAIGSSSRESCAGANLLDS